jgi:hypothetical protein
VQWILGFELGESTEITISRKQFLDSMTQAKCRYSRIVNRTTLNSRLLDESGECFKESVALVQEN